MKLRIAIVVLGLCLGLVARVAVEVYHHFQERRAPAQPAATATPLSIRADRAK